MQTRLAAVRCTQCRGMLHSDSAVLQQTAKRLRRDTRKLVVQPTITRRTSVV